MEIQFGKNLKQFRKKHGYSRALLAQKLHYSEKSVEKWESGDATPPLSVICALAELFCVPLESLVYEQKERIRYFLGVDGGGTKTDFRLEDKEGALVAECTLGGCNPNDIGMEACFAVIQNGITQVCEGINRAQIATFVGAAGSGIGENAIAMKKFLSRFGFGVCENGSDMDNLLELALPEQDGIAMIIGTGIIAFAQKDGVRHRIGGWGYLLDGGGSGYNVARDAMEAALRAYDGRGKPTALLARIEARLGDTLPRSIPTIHERGRYFIASFVPDVFAAADEGDTVALEIIDRNAAAIAEHIEAARRHFTEDVPVVLCGGLARRADLLQPRIEAHLSHPIPLQFLSKAMKHGAVERARRIYYEKYGSTQ